MKSSILVNAIAATDPTCRGAGRDCNGPMRFGAETGAGATVGLIVPRGRGGGNHLRNLGAGEQRRDAEKGIRWDGGRRGRRQPVRHEILSAAHLARRGEHWREAADSAGKEY